MGDTLPRTPAKQQPQTMDHKELVTRFTKACYRFEAIQGDLDILLFDTDSEIKAYEYEDLANQAAEIILKLSANGNNVGEHFYRYYVERLEYIIDYFRPLLDYGEIPLAEDEQDELDDEPGAEEEDDSEDEQSDEVDNENDTQAAESDETADNPAAGAPSSEVLLPPDVEHDTEFASKCWNELSSEERANVWDTFAMWHEMNDITGRNSGGGDYAEAVKELDGAEYVFSDARYFLIKGYPVSLLHNEQLVRKRIYKAIDAIPDFRDSEKFKKLIELYPTYKERLQ